MRINTAKICVLAVSIISFCGFVYAGEIQVSREPADKSVMEKIIINESPGQVISGTGTLGTSQLQRTKAHTEVSKKKPIETMNNTKPYVSSPDGTGDQKTK